MKISLVIAAMITLVTSVCLAGNWSVIGEVISVTDDGCLVKVDSKGAVGQSMPKDGTAVFVYNTNNVDGDVVRFTGLIKVEPDKYTATTNAAKTVMAFEFDPNR